VPVQLGGCLVDEVADQPPGAKSDEHTEYYFQSAHPHPRPMCFESLPRLQRYKNHLLTYFRVTPTPDGLVVDVEKFIVDAAPLPAHDDRPLPGTL